VRNGKIGEGIERRERETEKNRGGTI